MPQIGKEEIHSYWTMLVYTAHSYYSRLSKAKRTGKGQKDKGKDKYDKVKILKEGNI